jgi:hypothetical protein
MRLASSSRLREGSSEINPSPRTAQADILYARVCHHAQRKVPVAA